MLFCQQEQDSALRRLKEGGGGDAKTTSESSDEAKAEAHSDDDIDKWTSTLGGWLLLSDICDTNESGVAEKSVLRALLRSNADSKRSAENCDAALLDLERALASLAATLNQAHEISAACCL